MKRAQYLSIVQIIFGISFFIISSYVGATPYTFSVDRFEVSGNLSGDFIDDFNGSSIGTRWEIDDPSALEAGGVVTISNPGYTGVNLFNNNISIAFERSYIESKDWGMANGLGDFQATSTWTTKIPGINQFYGMDVFTGHHDEGITISVYNFGQDIADLFGVAPGAGIFFGRYEDNGEIDLYMQAFSITTADISGDILLRLAFDDDNDLFTGEFSLDGGNLFQSPFSGVTPNIPNAVYELTLGGEYWEVTPVPLPGAIWLLGSGLAGLAACRKKSKMKGDAFIFRD